MRQLANGFFQYETESEIGSGDVVRIASDNGSAYAAFSDCIVEKVEMGNVCLARPHVCVDIIDSTWVERFSVPVDMMMSRFIVFSSGTKKDNRKR